MANEKEKFLALESLQGNTRNNIADDIYNQISEMIIEGKLPAGYTFPNEIALCQHMGVGRSTLREAFRTLEAMGLIIRTKRGTCVNDKSHKEILPFPKVLKISRVQDNIEFRLTLEIGIAALAAERATAEDIQMLSMYLEKMKKNREDIYTLSYYDTLFHYQLAEASGNELLIATLKMAKESVELGMIEAFAKDSQISQRAIQFHGRLLQAVIEHEPQAARVIMSEHMDDVANTLKESF